MTANWRTIDKGGILNYKLICTSQKKLENFRNAVESSRMPHRVVNRDQHLLSWIADPKAVDKNNCS